MNDYFWFLLLFIAVPCICVTIYYIVDRICRYKEERMKWEDDD